MNKRLLAVAVGGALSGIAAAQAEVTIYGRLYPQFQIVSQKDATQPGTTVSNMISGPSATVESLPNRQEVNASSSNIGFKASTDLGGGLKAFMQIESEAPIDEGDGVLTSRSSFVGLSGGFGTVYLGRMDTVYKDLGGAVGFLGVSSGNFVSESNIIARNGAGTRNSNTDPFGGGFHRRQNHMVRYETPEFGGFQFLAQYAPDEEKTRELNRTVTSVGVKWEAGPLFFGLAHEIHKDFFGGSLNARSSRANAVFDFACDPGTLGDCDPDAEAEVVLQTAGVHSKDRATRFSWSWEVIKGTKIGGDFSKIEYKETGGLSGRLSKYEHDTFSFGVEHKMGNITLAANYADSDQGTCTFLNGPDCTTTGLDGNALALGIMYSFSKQVGVFGLWSKLENGDSARYDNLENGSPARGEDVTQAAIGVLYRF